MRKKEKIDERSIADMRIIKNFSEISGKRILIEAEIPVLALLIE